jgi:hypothetical protein
MLYIKLLQIDFHKENKNRNFKIDIEMMNEKKETLVIDSLEPPQKDLNFLPSFGIKNENFQEGEFRFCYKL